MHRIGCVLGAAAILLASGSCVDTGPFVCDSRSQCAGDGICGPQGYCADADANCPSGYRYVESAHPTLRNECVELCIQELSLGYGHGCVLLSDGSALCFGENDQGQLGLELQARALGVPTDLNAGGPVATVSTESGITCALTRAGELRCWGGPMPDSDVPELEGELVDVAAGAAHVCVLDAEGAVWCWGGGEDGQLGDGTRSSRETPAVVDELPPAQAISAGSGHTCALTREREIYCWGSNSLGQSGGIGFADSQLRPTRVGELDAVEDIDCNVGHCCAVAAAQVYCWGDNFGRQLGADVGIASDVPLRVRGIDAVSEVTAGEFFSCALRVDGTVWCWGANELGALGDGTFESRLTPEPVLGISDAHAIDAGSTHVCAALRSGELACWGDSRSGRLGDDPALINHSPVQTDLSGLSVISLGDQHGCAVDSSSSVLCWGANDVGQLGVGIVPAAQLEPQPVPLLQALDVVAGGYHTCALTLDRTVSCWGDNFVGQSVPSLLDEDTLDVPRMVDQITGPITSIGAGVGHTCVLDMGGDVRCWGNNENGQLGRAALTPVPGVSNVGTLAVGGAHSCAFDGTTVDCWGANEVGQLGGGDENEHGPFVVAGLPDDEELVQLEAGGEHSCALYESGSIWCWGRDFSGALGNGIELVELGYPPVPVATIDDAVEIGAGFDHTCARVDNGDVYCWGSNDKGQLGGLGLLEAHSPVRVDGIEGATSLVVGYDSTCVTTDSETFCWGANDAAQLAIGEPAPHPEPVRISLGCGGG